MADDWRMLEVNFIIIFGQFGIKENVVHVLEMFTLFPGKKNRQKSFLGNYYVILFWWNNAHISGISTSY